MKTYSVKQISELLETNPETVRRWIRDDKLKAIQISRKDGNVVSEEELQQFLKSTPKYMAKFSAGISVLSPVAGIVALAGGITASAIGYAALKGKTDYGIPTEELKKYLTEDIERLEQIVIQKYQLIQQTEAEISGIQSQIEQYRKILVSTCEFNTKEEK